jgi:hypothetical protein
MNDPLLLGIWRYLLRLPRPVWQGQVAKNAKKEKSGLDFLTGDVKRVRDYVVLELPRAGEPLSPQHIAGNLGLEVEHVAAILDDLEKRMTFLFRDPQGRVTWAYPVTVDRTQHRVEFSSGEKLYAA